MPNRSIAVLALVAATAVACPRFAAEVVNKWFAAAPENNRSAASNHAQRTPSAIDPQAGAGDDEEKRKAVAGTSFHSLTGRIVGPFAKAKAHISSADREAVAEFRG